MLTVDKNTVTMYVKKIFIKFWFIISGVLDSASIVFNGLQQEFISDVTVLNKQNELKVNTGNFINLHYINGRLRVLSSRPVKGLINFSPELRLFSNPTRIVLF